MMKIIKRIVIGVIIGIFLFWTIAFLLFVGAFGIFNVTDIETYESPDRQYVLTYQQIGIPSWPYGPVDIRFILRNSDGKKIHSVRTSLQNEGGEASEDNIQSIEWEDDFVSIVLQAIRMEDTEVIIQYE